MRPRSWPSCTHSQRIETKTVIADALGKLSVSRREMQTIALWEIAVDTTEGRKK